MEWIVLEDGSNPISPFVCLSTLLSLASERHFGCKKKKKNHDRTVNIDKEKYEINIFLFSCVRKYSLCGFRKINTNLLYTLTILIICKEKNT
jgi:hypothetical protein